MDPEERMRLRYEKLRSFGNGLAPLDPLPPLPAAATAK